jgi:aquaporin Z
MRRHIPEYLIEGFCLAVFLVSACSFASLLEYPGSPAHELIPNPAVRRVLMGLAMGLTAIILIYSPLGKRSGAHMNPATTLTFLRLGKIDPHDAFFYVLAQFVGGIAGVLAARVFLQRWLAHASVNYVATLPGAWGEMWAFAAELAIAFILMLVVLSVSNVPSLNRYTGLCAGFLVMLYISIEAPISGMSMNPARTLGSAMSAGTWTGLWIYFTAPLLGMLLAAEVYLRRRGAAQVLCAKLHHDNHEPCIFRCNFRPE